MEHRRAAAAAAVAVAAVAPTVLVVLMAQGQAALMGALHTMLQLVPLLSQALQAVAG